MILALDPFNLSRNYQNERGQNTHGQGERVKIPLLPNIVGKKSANDAGPNKGHVTNFLGQKSIRYKLW